MAERELYIAIGSNVEPERHIPAAVAALAPVYGPLAHSAAYRSAAIGFDGADFVNCVVRGRSAAPAEAIVARLKSLEEATGRRRGRTLGPRALDLDLILYGNEVIVRSGLTIPRADVLRYGFVLRPLAEIAPDMIHPQTGKTLAWHWAHFAGEGTPLEPVALDGFRNAANPD